MKKKTVYLLIFLIALLGVILFIRLSIKPSPVPSQNNIPVFSPNPSSPNQFIPGNEGIVVPGSLKILKDNTKREPVLLNEQIILIFNKPIAPNDLVIELEPATPYKVSVDVTSTNLILEPATGWEFQVNYTLKVSKNSSALDKGSLDKDYEFHFNTVRYIGY